MLQRKLSMATRGSRAKLKYDKEDLPDKSSENLVGKTKSALETVIQKWMTKTKLQTKKVCEDRSFAKRRKLEMLPKKGNGKNVTNNNIVTEVEINPITGIRTFKKVQEQAERPKTSTPSRKKKADKLLGERSKSTVILPANKDLINQFDEVDREFEELNPDNVVLGLDDGQDKEFNSEGEDIQEGNQSDQYESEGELSESNSEVDLSEGHHGISKDDSSGIVAFREKDDDQEQFHFLRGTPAFENYIKKVVTREIRT